MPVLRLRRAVGSTLAVILAAAALHGLGGCGDFVTCENSWHSSDRIGVVVSLSVPDTIATRDTLRVDLEVRLESSVYSEYRYTQVYRDVDYATITPVVELVEYAGTCDPPSMGDPYEVSVQSELAPSFPEGPFEVRIRQPADSVLVRVVQVVDATAEGVVTEPH
jgi:hypothetical protein